MKKKEMFPIFLNVSANLILIFSFFLVIESLKILKCINNRLNKNLV